MSNDNRNIKEAVIEATKHCGILPCIKLKKTADCLPYAQAMYDGGARVIEVTMTTPKALEAIEAFLRNSRGGFGLPQERHWMRQQPVK